MLVLEISKKTLFIKLDFLFPECKVLIEDYDQLFPLRCLADFCPRNANCMERLAHRVKWVFDTFKEAEMLILYFAWRDRPGTTRCGVFTREMTEPLFRIMNRTAWDKFKKLGVIYEVEMPKELLLSGQSKTIIPASDLVK